VLDALLAEAVVQEVLVDLVQHIMEEVAQEAREDVGGQRDQ
jgi:hypothetical protein